MADGNYALAFDFRGDYLGTLQTYPTIEGLREGYVTWRGMVPEDDKDRLVPLKLQRSGPKTLITVIAHGKKVEAERMKAYDECVERRKSSG